jgi:hypothetical protein
MVQGRRVLRRSTMAHYDFAAALGSPGTVVLGLGTLLVRAIHEPEK